MVGYVVAHMEFKNLPPNLGIYARHHLLDKVWKQVTADITYVHCAPNGDIISSGVLDNVEFDKYCADKNICSLVHTQTAAAYYYTAMSGSKIFDLNNQYPLMPSLAYVRVVDDKETFSTHFNKFGGTVIEYLEKYSRYIRNGAIVVFDLKKLFRKRNKQMTMAEQLHSRNKHLPDPIQWVRLGYKTDEVNEYTEFMSRFDFSEYVDKPSSDIYKLFKSIHY